MICPLSVALYWCEEGKELLESCSKCVAWLRSVWQYGGDIASCEEHIVVRGRRICDLIDSMVKLSYL